jgi:hypothetical protein
VPGRSLALPLLQRKPKPQVQDLHMQRAELAAAAAAAAAGKLLRGWDVSGTSNHALLLSTLLTRSTTLSAS